MSDSSYVTLVILASQEEKLEPVLKESDYTANDILPLSECVSYGFELVNYGNLPFLDKLRDAGIAYSSTWEDGYEYSRGTAYCRFTPDGECIEKSIYDDDVNPDLAALMRDIDNPVALRQFIIDHRDKVTVAALDENQVEYGKRYQARKLITPA